MRAVSLWQPYASLMAMGLKKVETRPWSTKYRGPLLIHAARRMPSKQELFYVKWKLWEYVEETEWLDDMPFGVILCRVDLIDCKPTAEPGPSILDLEFYLGNYERDRFMWFTDSLTAFENPIPWKGRQRFFNVPDSVIPLSMGKQRKARIDERPGL